MKNNKVIIIVVVVAVAVAAGGFFWFQQYRAERAARKIIQEGLGGLVNVLPSGDLANLPTAGQPAEPTEEEKTPEENFQETVAMEPPDETIGGIIAEEEPILKGVFDGAKATNYVSGSMVGAVPGSGLVNFILKRAAAAGDANALTKALTGHGYSIITSSKEGTKVDILASKNSGQYSFSFEIGEQEIAVTLVKLGAMQ